MLIAAADRPAIWCSRSSASLLLHVGACAGRLAEAALGAACPISVSGVYLNVLLAVFNMVPVPPLDGGNVLAGVLRGRSPRCTTACGPYGFMILYGLMFTGVLTMIIAPPATLPAGLASAESSMSEPRVVSGMRPTGKLHLGHLVGALQNWVALQEQYDCFYFVADWHALTSEYANTGASTAIRARQRRRLARGRRRSGAQHDLRPVARAGARRAVPAALDGHADAVARARADLQGAAGAAVRQATLDARVPRLSAAADGRHPHVRRAVRAGRRGPGAAPRADARDRAPLQPVLRRHLRRAAAAPDATPRLPASTTAR